jgi:hypothetical protein
MDRHHQQGDQTPPRDANVLPDPFETPKARRIFPVATPAHHGSQHAGFNTQPDVGGSSLTLNSDGGYETEVSAIGADEVHQSRAGSPTPARGTTRREGVPTRLRSAKAGNPSSSKISDGISAAQYGTLKGLLEAALGKLEAQEVRINQLQDQANHGYASEQRNWTEFGKAWNVLDGKWSARHDRGIRLEQRGNQMGQDQPKDKEKGKEKEKKEAPSGPRRQEKETGKEPQTHQPQQRGRTLQHATTTPLPPPMKIQTQPSKPRTFATAVGAAGTSTDEWTESKSKKTLKTERQQAKAAAAPTKTTPMEKRRILLVRDQSTPATAKKDADILSAINCALFKVGVPYWICLRDVRRNERGTITGTTAEFCTADMLLQYRDNVIIAARTVDKGIVGIEANESWQKVKIHGVPLDRYVGKGTQGLEKFREEVQAENAGVVIPLAVRWLGKMSTIKERWANGEITSSSVTFAVKGEAAVKKMVREGVRVCGLRYKVELYLEERPESQCSNCARWRHIKSNCNTPSAARCNYCAQRHRTDDHQCDVIGCRAGQGQLCMHVDVKCPNCKGNHLGMSRQCEAKQAATAAGRGWRPVNREHQQERVAEDPGSMEVEPTASTDDAIEQPNNDAQQGTTELHHRLGRMKI